MKHTNNNTVGSVETLEQPFEVSHLIQAKINELESMGSDAAFFVGDLGDIILKYKQWKRLLPRVEPFYAVKCNQDHHVVKLLSDLGIGFDCASKMEIEQILKLGISPSRIIYANPCKQRSFLKYAAKHQVDLMTFDNEAELIKVRALFPNARLVLRILPTSQFKVQCELGNKFGCHPSNVLKLLLKAQELDLNVVGISFHVGSGVAEAEAFACAVRQAYDAWQMAVDVGFEMTLLDIGGGFPGQKSAPVTFPEIASVLNDALDLYFPAESGIKVIAEPGRYFVASAFTLTTNIIAKRAVARDLGDAGPPDGHHCQDLTCNDEPSYMYYVNDGVYGSFNSLLYDHASVQAEVLADPGIQFTSSVWGPTCDGLDCILEECRLPEMEVGDWIYYQDMGAYTMCAGSTFNGMPRPECFYYCCSALWADTYEEVQSKKKLEAPSGEADYPLMKTGPDMDVLRSTAVTKACHSEEEVVCA